MTEEWKPLYCIPEIKGQFLISNMGRVKRIGHTDCKKTTPTKSGYLHVTFWYNNSTRPHRLHRLVAMTFVPNPNNYPEVNHINGDKKDCRAENLEWCTRSQNNLHKYRALGQTNKGRHHWTEEERKAISEKRKAYYQVHPELLKSKTEPKPKRVKKVKPKHVNKCDWSNPEEVKKYYKQRYTPHPRKRSRDWDDPEVMRAYRKEYRAKHPKKKYGKEESDIR